MKRGIADQTAIIITVAVFLTAFLVSTYNGSITGEAKASPGPSTQCNDHIDNDKDGYCDYQWRKAYCSDGSILGDKGCSGKDDNDEANCGDKICTSPNEDYTNCPSDCPASTFCGDNVCNINEDYANCPSDCGNLRAELTISTLIDTYKIGELVKLTDPPIELENKFDRADQILTKDTQDLFVPSNYIIKLKDKSILEKKAELDEKTRKGIISVDEGAVELNNYKRKIIDQQNLAKNDLKSRVSNLVIKKDYKNVFNGFHIIVSEGDIEKIKSSPFVEKAFPDVIVSAVLTDSVPLINADKVWSSGYTGQSIEISIIDTGVGYTHTDLGGCYGTNCKVISGYDFVNNDNDPMDDHGHGTHVAAIAAGNGVLKGVAPDAKLYAYKVLGSAGSGTFSNVIAAIEKSVDPNNDGIFTDQVDIISMSLGANCGNYPSDICGADDPASQAVDVAVNNGVVVVVAAGNSGPNYGTIGSPGTARRAITVGAVDKSGIIAPFSSRGPVESIGGSFSKPNLVAPGVSICAARWDNAWSGRECIDAQHVSLSGTSMATPHVSGAVALLKQARPDWTPKDIAYALSATAKNLNYDVNTQGSGEVDIFQAINLPITRIKSQIKNTGTVDLNGYLLMKIQKLSNTLWTDVKVMVNENTPRTIPSGQALALDKVWESAGAFTTSEQGAFRVYAALRHSNGEVITTSNRLLEGYYQFEVLPGPSFCGDNVCNVDETCSTCSQDCGTCAFTLTRIVSLPKSTSILTSSPEIDFDNNGKREFVLATVVSDPWTTALNIYEGSNDNSFVKIAALPINSQTPMDWGDSDRDGFKELLVQDYNIIRLYEATSSSPYPSIKSWETQIGSWAPNARISDLDNDNKDEIAFASGDLDNIRKIQVYENTADNSYNKVFSVSLPDVHTLQCFNTMNDLDNDIKKEMIVGGLTVATSEYPSGASFLYLYENTGDNSFSQTWSHDLLADNNQNLVNCADVIYLGDSDGDGKKEFVAGGMKTINPSSPDPYSNVYYVFESTGDNTFQKVAEIKKTGGFLQDNAIAAGDLDGDGRNEIVIVISKTAAYVFKSSGDNQFSEIWSHTWSTPATVAEVVDSIGIGDHDNDGKEEIIFKEYNATVYTQVYEKV